MLYRSDRFAYPEKAAGELARSLGFGLLVSQLRGELHFSHLPLLVDVEDDRIVRVRGHLARRNPHADALLEEPRATVVFNGPNAYISAQWFTEDNPAAPSWNYVVVHVSGPVTLAASEDETSAIVDELIDLNEGRLPRRWPVEDYSPERRARLLPHIVGFSLDADLVEPKFKLLQHYPDADKVGVIRGLREDVGADGARGIADYMETTVSEAGNASGRDITEELGATRGSRR